jgi:hypothetical protein
MKKVRNLLLLALSASLLIGCSKSWNNKSDSNTSGEQSEPSSSEPYEPSEPGNYDVTYPIQDPGLNPIDPTYLNTFLNGVVGTELNERVYRDFFGDDFFDAVLNSNHMKEEQIGQLFNIVKAVAEATERDEPTLDFFIYLFDQLNHLDMDSAIITIRDLKANEKGWAGFSRLIKADHYPFEGSLISYASADKALNGSNPGIKAGAEYEYEFDKLTFDPEESYTYEGLFELIEDDGALGFFRFVGHTATCLKEYMTDDEIKYLLCLMAGEEFESEKAKLEETLLATPESIKNFANHAGNAFTNMNLNEESWENILPAFKKFATIMTKIDLYDSVRPELTSNFNAIDSMMGRIFTGLRPVAIKSMIKFVGLLGINATEDVISAAMGDPDQPLTLVSTYYNRIFGLLNEREKNNVDEGFFVFGVDIAKFNDDLNEVAATGDFEAIQELAEQAFSTMGDAFSYDREHLEVGSSTKEEGIFFKQGDSIDTNRLKTIFATGDYFDFYGESSEDIAQRQYEYIKGVDTSTPGHKTMRVKITYKHYDSFETVDVMISYFVVPSNVQFFMDRLDITIQPQDSHSIYDNYIYEDENGNRASRIGKRLILQKDQHFAADKIKVRVETDEPHFYLPEQYRYVHRDSRILDYGANTEMTVDVSTLDTSTIGTHYVTGFESYKVRETGTVVSIPVFFAYEVVNEIVSNKPVEDAHIEL